MRAETAREFFEGAPERVDASRTRGFRASYRFEIDDAGTWWVEFDDGKMRIEQGDAEADVVVRTSERTFLRIVNREGSPMTALLNGKVRIEGDMGLLLKLRKFLL
jgi:putative sterol carrier protein